MYNKFIGVFLAIGIGLTGCASFTPGTTTFDQLGQVNTYPVNDSSIRLTFKQKVNRDIDVDDVALLHASLWAQKAGFPFFSLSNIHSVVNQKVVNSFRPSMWLQYRADFGGRGRGHSRYGVSIASPYWWYGPYFDPYWGGGIQQTTVTSLPSVSMTVTGYNKQNSESRLYNTDEVIASLSAIYRSAPTVGQRLVQ